MSFNFPDFNFLTMPSTPTFRRSTDEPRLEMVPLIDVIFLVLTFFIYAMVLMIPAKVLPMRLPVLAAGTSGEPKPAITISIAADGRVAVDREYVELDQVLTQVQAALESNPGAVVYVAAAADADVNQMPAFIEIYQQLFSAGLDIRLVGNRE